MKKFTKVNLPLLLFLMVTSTLTMICLAVLVTLTVPIVVYFRVGVLQYQVLFLIDALKIGATVGLTVGIGIWLIAKIEEIIKRRSLPPDS
ncbi:hypothetical protein ABK905_05515 [Acerihabitans sp. KWT182]|uniref:Uncharacterized protein n=1 Tax=Acerihabitans sp. KWT182 TaxID=3157919 RepID=A0AAU7QC18_9GAMM